MSITDAEGIGRYPSRTIDDARYRYDQSSGLMYERGRGRRLFGDGFEYCWFVPPDQDAAMEAAHDEAFAREGVSLSSPSANSRDPAGDAYRRVEAALAALRRPIRNGKALCPTHDDKRPSLSIKQGRDGAVLHCFAMCKTGDVLHALGLNWADLFDRPALASSAEPGAEVALRSVSFTGAELLALLDRPEPPPVEAARPTPGHFSLWIGPPISGKTTLGIWNAMARAAGVAPWPGASARPAARVLIYSLDEAPAQVVRRMDALARQHPAGPLAMYIERITVIGPDRERDTELLERLRFDKHGLATITRWVTEGEATGDPFVEVYVDAYADVLPIGESENSNEEGTRIGGALERLAVRHGPAVTVYAHVGKPKADTLTGLPDIRYLARGASALAAKARTVSSLELIPNMPSLRRVRTATNLGRTPREVMFEVCPQSATEEQIDYFRPSSVDPTRREPREFMKSGETIATNELARRLAGPGLAPGRDIPGAFKMEATRLRGLWEKEGKISVGAGPKGAKTLTLVEPVDPVGRNF